MYVVSPSSMAQLLDAWATGADPLNEQLAAAIGQAIERGDLAAGARLPSERDLAAALGLSRTTIVLAYGRLRDAGLIRSRQGSGTRVVAREDPGAAARPGLIQPYVAPIDARSLGRSAPAGLLATVPSLYPDEADDGVIELTIGALRAAPIVLRAAEEAIREDVPALMRDFGYRPFGLPALRDEIAAHFDELGVPTDPDQIVVTSGAQQAVDLVAQELVGRDGIAALENPTYVGAIDAMRSAGARMIPLPSDDDGLRVDLAAAAITATSVRVLLVVPTYQNPTGSLLPEERRRELARLAADSGTIIVEDLTPDIGLGRGVPPPIAAFDRAGRVVTIGSLSKVGWGGLRLGWIRAPQALVGQLLSRKTIADHGTSTITQAIGRRLLVQRSLLAEQTLAAAAERRTVVSESLRELLPDWEWREPAGGLSTWVRLPDADAGRYARIAAEHGVIVRPGPLFSPDGGCRDYLRIAIGEEPDRLREGIVRMAAAWEASRDHVRRERPLLSLSV
jgi:DNA-binding transcriptional MocR family regulator